MVTPATFWDPSHAGVTSDTYIAETGIDHDVPTAAITSGFDLASLSASIKILPDTRYEESLGTWKPFKDKVWVTTVDNDASV